MPRERNLEVKLPFVPQLPPIERHLPAVEVTKYRKGLSGQDLVLQVVRGAVGDPPVAGDVQSTVEVHRRRGVSQLALRITEIQ